MLGNRRYRGRHRCRKQLGDELDGLQVIARGVASRDHPAHRPNPTSRLLVRGSGPLKAKGNLPGIKKLLLPRPADTASLDTSVPARALFGPPPEAAVAEKRSSLVDFLKQVTLFEDLSRWDLRRLARIGLDRLVEQAVPGGRHGP